MPDKTKPGAGPVTLTPPNVSPPPALRAVPAPPETCCRAHDNRADQHDLDCLVGMVYRVSPEALDAFHDAVTRVVQRAADALAASVLAAQTAPPSALGPPGAKVHESINAFNKLREVAGKVQDLVREREALR